MGSRTFWKTFVSKCSLSLHRQIHVNLNISDIQKQRWLLCPRWKSVLWWASCLLRKRNRPDCCQCKVLKHTHTHIQGFLTLKLWKSEVERWKNLCLRHKLMFFINISTHLTCLMWIFTYYLVLLSLLLLFTLRSGCIDVSNHKYKNKLFKADVRLFILIDFDHQVYSKEKC